MRITCNSVTDIVEVFNHNTEVFTHGIKKINQKITRLNKKSRSHVWLGIIFGTVIELCFIEQNQKIAALGEQISALNAEIKELRDKEGE